MKSNEMRRRGEGKAGAWIYGACLLAALLMASCGSDGSGSQAQNDGQVSNGARESDSTRLMSAVRSGDIDEVRRVFEEIGKDINDIYDDGERSPLAFAVIRENVEIVEFLLSEGADPNGSSESLPIISAAFKGSIVLVKLLLEHGADPNIAQKHGVTALGMTDSTAVAKLLLDAGADIDAQANDGQSALHNAVYLLSLRMVSLLVSEGANIEAMDNAGETALDYAVRITAGDEDEVEAQESIIDLLNEGESQ